MENFISMISRCRTTHQIIILFVLLQANSFVAVPMWIWTEGCVKGGFTSNDAINLTNNLPATCFRACGGDSTHVALQGNFCYCNNSIGSHVQSDFCGPCEENEMLDCGNSSKGYWSVYRKASQQELADHKIPLNTTGCVIHSKRSFRVDNCSRNNLHSLCQSTIFRNKQYCNDHVQRWSLHACDIRFSRLISTFDVKTNECSQLETWIGLFALEEQSYMDSSVAMTEITTASFSVPKSSSVPISSAEILPSPAYLETDMNDVSTPFAIPSSTITISPTRSSSNIAITSVINTMLTEIRDVSTTHFYSKNPETIVTENTDEYSSNSFHITPTEYSPSKTLTVSSSLSHSSLTTRISHVQGDNLASIMTAPLSNVPVISQSVTFTKHWQSLSSTILTKSTVKNVDKTTQKVKLVTDTSVGKTQTEKPITKTTPVKKPVTKTTETEKTVTKTTETEKPVTKIIQTEKPATKTIQTENPVTKTTPTEKPVTKTTETEKPVTKPTQKVKPVGNTTQAKTSVGKTTQAEKPVTKTPTYLTNDVSKQTSRTDLLIVISVVGVIAGFALITLGIMVAYINRSLKKVRRKLNKTTFTGNNTSNHVTENLSQTSLNDDFSGYDTSSGFCPRGIRANLDTYHDTRTIFYNGRTRRENDYVLY